MTRTIVKALTVAAVMGVSALILPAPAEAGHGWGGHGWGGGHWHGGWGWGGPGYWGAGLIGLGVGAAVGAALTAPAYVGPPPPGPSDGRRRLWASCLVTRMVHPLRPVLPQLQPAYRLLHRIRRAALFLPVGRQPSPAIY